MLRIFLLCSFAILPLCAASPDLDETSPNGIWTLHAHWLDQGLGGYNWILKNKRTGEIYFEEKPGPDEILPHGIDVLWSPQVRYVAVTFYYGRAVQEVMVIPLTNHPELIGPLPNSTKTPLEKTLLHPEDAALFTGYNRLLTNGDHWINDMDLSIGIDMLCFLKDRAAGFDISLSTSWHKTVRFEGKTPSVIASTCDVYDKEPVSDK